MTFSIHKCDPMPTRPCTYCLCFNEGSVFADLDLDAGKLHLVRISFDGYGCFHVNDPAWVINTCDSKRIVDWIESDDVNHDAMCQLLTDYILDRNTSEIDEALAHNGMPT